ncbi:hypothetical protein J4441_02265 [Candidatus Micrarchaeota archaeon]|nr:hypothetical protein [Candidatus Micrarchaeota archaeon]
MKPISALSMLAIFSLALFFGCTEKVDVQQYQQVAAERDSYLLQLEDLRISAADYETRLNAAEKNYAGCLSQKADAAGEATSCRQELLETDASLENATTSLLAIRASTAKYEAHLELLNDYSELFETAAIPTYSKISEYEQKVKAFNDTGLFQTWKDFIDCPADAVCTPKREAYKSYIKDRMAEGAAQIYSTIKAN